MDKTQFYKILKEKIVILDGATGTELQNKGMPKGACPEQWILENPNAIIDIQKSYVEAGSMIVYAPTFGANRWKLKSFGLEEKVREINIELVKLSKKAVGDKALVAGNLSPTGEFIKPFGEKSFEEAVEVYKEQVNALLEGGVDLFIIETMIDIQEARAALLAVKESTNLPVMVSMTFQEEEKTLTGTDPITAVITLESLGADAIGCNCSTGPKDMIPIAEKMKKVSSVPIFVKPNAGLPIVKDGKLFYDLGAKEFSEYLDKFARIGVNLIGGCCGTNSEYIKLLSEKAKKYTPKIWKEKRESAVSSVRKTVFIGEKTPLQIVGERINPTGKKKLQQELLEGKLSEVRRFAIEQQKKGASMLDVNVGMHGINEKEIMIKVIENLSTFSELPLCIDSSNPEVIEEALRIYPGRALINSISGEEKKLKKLLPIAAKYGAMFIALPLDDKEVPSTAKGRIAIIDKILKEAKKVGCNKEDMVVDGLVMTVSSDNKAPIETLKVIEYASKKLKVSTIIGLSNISFGLPERKWLNSGFLMMAMAKGLNMAIANPSSENLMELKMAGDVLIGRDENCKNYISYFGNVKNENIYSKEKEENTRDKIYNSVLKGEKEEIIEFIKDALDEGIQPFDIVDEILIPAINKVGDLYDKKEYFLPQLILSAEAMKKGFDYLEPLLLKKDNNKTKEKVVIATVKGDIHDIGKNIVGLMLKNYGFEVIDLGKDVPTDDIINKAKESNAPIIGLSALMTTTMVEMKNVIEKAKKENLTVKFMIGGAVITKEYAKEIGADGYASDAIEAVRLAQEFVGNNK
ncbi:homocysteine S-methyltransferase family protein [Defluviitalea phaphyphila]|uniref:homocysteine S-methyltransferase family protein n=1 Tax=Defluviitalea phaphyphila TaxID=1473580 RepID=UPI000730ADEE|nr:homocysteine S-methyltransferase family protein [Defluviitalea phaphyphila]